ncbi:glutamate-5-semialdehyde dehydrogenase [Atopobiaceae bacterium 24-176]
MTVSDAVQCAQAAKVAAPSLAAASSETRSAAILAAAATIDAAADDICEANRADMARGVESGMAAPLLDRLLLDADRLAKVTSAMAEVAAQDDPLGVVEGGRVLASGISLTKVSVPLGVVAVIYEARPNVTADSIALCLRSGNACVLRGGSAARKTCAAIAAAARRGIASAGLSPDVVRYVESEERSSSVDLMHATGLVDALIPRGGASLIRTCVEESKVPVIETGTGNCHIYLEASADASMAEAIVTNAKTSRPGVCNAAESLLVDRCAAERLLPPVLRSLAEHGVALVGDEGSCEVSHAAGVEMGRATEEDWGREYLDLAMSVRLVDGVDEAVELVNRYGTGHSECIVTESYRASERFLAGADAAAVYVNASTRFTDGGMFGLGAEIGISTQKLHVRGPMGASALTSTKYLLRGNGQVRQ